MLHFLTAVVMLLRLDQQEQLLTWPWQEVERFLKVCITLLHSAMLSF